MPRGNTQIKLLYAMLSRYVQTPLLRRSLRFLLHIVAVAQKAPGVHDLGDSPVGSKSLHLKDVVEGSDIGRVTHDNGLGHISRAGEVNRGSPGLETGLAIWEPTPPWPPLCGEASRQTQKSSQVVLARQRSRYWAWLAQLTKSVTVR